ncbi:uncharacterized protein KD926_010982 [Aspergillus affinis]|uniref:uncharacterized protein n=1 Tax=Aspergillus affinis TaxID=1070780 RepID=UPI0022FEFBE0|nr:uncharacterized protein KD926_010982 [Aspergillus affinis]KAI9044810.1 hypothetical protein KD926_010982 [Aspergillus affinis]
MSNSRCSAEPLTESTNKEIARRQIPLPGWLDHFNARDLKVLFRCWVAAWIASLLIFIGPALHRIRIATFFAALVLYIVPPGGILSVYLLASLSLLFGMCLAWAWGLLTMKAALAARPDSQTQARLQALQQQVAADAEQSGLPASLLTQKAVYDGFMLDARVTVVFYVMICLFVYTVSRLRVANQKFALAQIFGIIIADLFLLFGPVLPSFSALLPRVLVEPGAIGIGLGVACNVVFFAQSASSTVLTKAEQLVSMVDKPLQCTRSRFSGKAVDLGELEASKARTIALLKTTEPALAFLPLDVSWGRWSPEDVKSLYQPLRRAMVAGLSLLDFHISHVRTDKQLEQVPRSPVEGPNIDPGEKPPQVGRHQLQESADFLQALRSPEEAEMRAHTRNALQASTAELLHLSSESLIWVAEMIHTVNSEHWVRRTSSERITHLLTRGQSLRSSLESARENSRTKTTARLLESHAEMFDATGQLKSRDQMGPHSLRGLVLGMVVEERILGAAKAIEELLTQATHLLQDRSKLRLWLPSRLRYALSWLVNRRHPAPAPDLPADGGSDPDLVAEQTKEAHRRLRVNRGHGRLVRHNFLTRAIVTIYQWLTNSGGLYALRMVVVTIATAIPGSLPHTAGFYYREKGIWCLITAQTTLLVYMADFTVCLVGRTAGTVVGGVMGMAAWYIGSGNGPGNAYRLAASTAAMTLVLMWWRLFLPPVFTMGAIMSGATFMLVLGFSYDDTHMPQYGLPGHGYTAFYKRLVTVLLGFVAAFVVQIFPRPPSATRHTCQTLSNTVRTLSDHYALLLSHWGRARPEGSGDETSPVGVVAEKISLDVAETLLSAQQSIALLRFEMTLGPFDSQTLSQAARLCQDINQALGRLLLLSDTLPGHLQSRLSHTVGILDDRHIGDIMGVLSIIEQALRLGLALPERLPTPLIKRCYESWHEEHREAHLSTKLVQDENYRRYCVGISAYLKFLAAIDEMVLVLKGALGESHLVRQWDGDELV